MRKNVFRLFALSVFLLTALLAFGGGGQEGTTETAEPAAAVAGKEAPALAEMVKAGTLPPLAERLPIEPAVVQPLDEIGMYGGTWGTVYKAPGDSLAYGRLVYDPTLRYSLDGQEILPNLAKAWDLAPDGKTITLYFREGTKWSDGELFTADDVLFWYEDIAMNEELSPSPPSWMVAAGEAGKVEKVDDYTVRVSFSAPYPLLTRAISTYNNDRIHGIAAPKHYLEQFHPKYADKATLDKLVKDENLENWTQLFGRMNSYWNNPEKPVLSAWKMTNEPGASRLIAERNPYYWKVDTAGNQLPYIDRVVLDLVESNELILLKALNGEYDMQFRHISFQDYTVLKEGEADGDYKIITHTGDRASDVCFWPNLSHDDPVYNELMNNVEFKKALSYAIDRDEINELFYFGLGTPRAITAISSEPTYEEDVAQMHIKYDPDEANRILDRIGFDKRDDNGIRLGPDGKPIFFLLQYATVWPQFGSVGEVVADYWKEIGIDSLIKPMERAAWTELSYSNQLPLALFTSPGTSLGNAWWMVPTYHNSNAYGVWRRTGGKEGKEPPEGSKVLKAIDLYAEALTAGSFDDTVAMIKQVLRWGVEELWGIGIVGETPVIGVLSNRMRNVAKVAPSGSHLSHPGNLVPEQFFIKE